MRQPGRLPLLILTAASAACEQPTGAAVIGYAFPRDGQRAAIVAAAALPTDTALGAIRIVGDWDSGGTESAVEIARARRLVALPRVMGVVGHVGSRSTLITAPIYSAAGIPLVVPTATSGRLWEIGEWVFPLAPSDSMEAAFLGEAAVDGLKASRIAVYFVNTAYGSGIRGELRRWLGTRGMAPVDEVPYVIGADLATLVQASLRRTHPDLTVLVGRRIEVAQLAALIYEHDPSIRLLAADGAYDQLAELIAAAGPAADSLYLTTFWVADTTVPVQRDFVRRYRNDTGRDPTAFEAMRYDAIMVLAQAIREAGPDRAAIRDWLASLGGSRPPFQGVTGNVTFRRGARRNLLLVRLREGRPVSVPEAGVW
ncbi:MAG TPA: ABC transporter substrate-binding protein [Gemmatimonadales bacterium]|nr:ABC transporter substrate-binding protein [Gemmatimonadales bacterium]